MNKLDQVTIMGIPFINTYKEAFVQLLDKRIQNKEKTFVVTANPEIVMQAQEDTAFMNHIQQADYVTADGIGIVKASEMLGEPLPDRITGYDTMMNLLSIANDKHYKIYMLGAKKETLDKAVKRVESEFPHAEIVGSHDGYFDWENNDIAEQMEETKPDIVFVALGAPRQEKWIAENIDRFSHGVFMGIGGSFDVLAGTVRRAPKLWQNLNLEWLYRLLKQPSRWRRYLAMPRFVIKIMKMKSKR